MIESAYSPLWYRVAALRPKLRNHVRVDRQIYRGQTWYLLHDGSSGRHHRINELGYQFAGRLDGRFSVEQLSNLLAEELGERSPTQDEIIQILVQLYQLDLIQTENLPEFGEVFQRRDERSRKRWSNDVNPLSFKVRLFDPSAWLARFEGVARKLYTPSFLALWVVIAAIALLALRANWDEVTAFAGTQFLTPRFLLLTWLCYPVIKAVHELAHAFAVKAFGGDVHEMGVRVLFLTPIPYVDASAANGFRHRWKRVVVSLAGIAAEVMMAALALFVWLNVSNGWVRDATFVIMFIGGVSTVLFNGNPLLRFDGYYALADALDLPNLAQRSTGYWAYLGQRYVCQLRAARCPANTLSERAWFFGYGAAALGYRWFVSLLIVMWISAKSLVIALALGAWFLYLLLAKPLAAAIGFLLTAPQLGRRRAQAIAGSALLLAATAATLVFIPMPSSTVAQGVVWLPEQARIRARIDGFISGIPFKDGSTVRRGDTIALLHAPALDAKRKELVANLESLEAQYQKALTETPGEAAAVEQARDQAVAELARAEEQLRDLQVQSPADGVLAMPYQDDLHEGYVQRGTVLAHLLTESDIEVRVVVAHEDASLVRERHERVGVQLLDAAGASLPGRWLREVPAATNALPSAALSDRFGGSIVTDPQDPEALRALEPIFLFDVAVPARHVERIGTRAWVRFDHGSEPLAKQWSRKLRQLVLRHFAVQS